MVYHDSVRGIDQHAFEEGFAITISDDGREIHASGTAHLSKREREYIKDLAFKKNMRITDPNGIWNSSINIEAGLWANNYNGNPHTYRQNETIEAFNEWNRRQGNQNRDL